jgi:hypothetical protein
MKLNEGAFFAIAIAGLTMIALCSISLDYWSANQVRMTYQTAYTKNQDCRIASQKSGFTKSIEKICGKVPTWEDYQK